MANFKTKSKLQADGGILLPQETQERVLTIDANGDIKSSGTTTTQLSFLDATSSVQTQLNSKASGVNVEALIELSGMPANSENLGTFEEEIIPVDSTIKEALQALETEIALLPQPFFYAGTYNPATNTPDIDDEAVRIKGATYYVTADGSHDFGAFGGVIELHAGDKLAFNGATWDKWDHTDAVSSVFGRSGAVTAMSGDYSAEQVSFEPSATLESEEVQAAIEEVDAKAEAAQSDLADHINSTAAHAAEHITLSSLKLDATNVKAGLEEVSDEAALVATNLNNHITATEEAHEASAIAYDNTVSGLLAEDTQAAIDELKSELNAIPDAFVTSVDDTASIDLTVTAGALSATALPAGIDHNALQNYEADEHVDHSEVEIIAGAGLSGGGDITKSRTLTVDIDGQTALGEAPAQADSFMVYDASTATLKKVTYAELLAGIPKGSPGDIQETSFNGVVEQSSLANITGLAFSNSVVRSFEALVSVRIEGTEVEYSEVFTLRGVQKSSGWEMSVISTGDDSKIEFDITSAGQVQYTSESYDDAEVVEFKFRAITTSI